MAGNELLPQLMEVAKHTLAFYGCFFYFWLGKGATTPLEKFDGAAPPTAVVCPFFKGGPQDSASAKAWKKYAKVHCYSLASIFYLWNKPHYRKGSYAEDLRDNLRNVAIPGTGIPLSIFALNRLTALYLILCINPVVCLVAAWHYSSKNEGASLAEEYAIRLLAPNDWFSYWRLNSRVAAMHAYLNQKTSEDPKENGYTMENKWTFLREGAEKKVPISPFMDVPAIVVKHKNEEGGLGIHFYKNATDGGDWIIQEKIDNSDWVSSMLPTPSPLSTFRVITQSRASLRESADKYEQKDVTALSCVFRAGRKGAATDHDSILFDINPKTGDLLKGTTNAHWYRLGLHEILPGRCPWRSTHGITHHPDGNIPVTGNHLKDIDQILHLVEKAHFDMCPDVPLAGWDVVLSADKDLPVCLLEVNLSCNFFRGTFDQDLYLDFIEDSFVRLQELRLQALGDAKKQN